jgi:excisionase family DNA binding protein
VMTPAQVAQMLAVTEADIMSAIEAGDLKAKKIGSAFRLSRTEVEAFMAK